MAVNSAISSPLGPASCDKDTKALQFIEETTRNADLVQERVSNTGYLKRSNLNGATDCDSFKSKLPVITYEDPQPEIQRIANGDRSPILSAHPISEFLTSLKKAVIKVGEPIYKARDFLLNRRGGGGGGGGGGGEGGDGEESDVEGGDGEESDAEGGGGAKKKLRPTPEMLQLIASTTIANTAQTFGSAISLKVGGLTLLTKILLILVMATGLAGYLFSITAIWLMHKSPRFSHVWVWTGCAATALGFLILIVAFVLEL